MTRVIQATSDDLEDMVRIDREVIGDESRRNYLKQAIEENRCFVGQIEGKTVGYIVFDTHFYGNGFVSLLMVSPSYRRKGVAKALMLHIEKICPTEKLFSSTNESNDRMQKVFESLGYVRSGFIDNLDEGDPEIIYFKKMIK